MAVPRRASVVTVSLLLVFALPCVAEVARTSVGTHPPAANAEKFRAKLNLRKEPLRVFVQLTEESAARAYSRQLKSQGRVSGRIPPQLLAAADAAARAQRVSVLQQQTRFESKLRAMGTRFTEIYRIQRALNGIAMEVDPAALPAIRKLPEVARIIPMQLMYPTAAPQKSNAVPYLQVPSVWQRLIGSTPNDGTGIRIGVIDTGLDYLHADFGGSGLLADYEANDTTTAPDAFFPNSKVVGGWDFVGDDYPLGPAAPDPDPMDCNSHGTHVAGIAAGYGVTNAGARYPGPYDGSVPFSTLRIHPGVAPGALLYPLRVFGCLGGSNFVAAALDRAMDPNNDSNLSDHLDVVNLSVGARFGSRDDPESLAADAAAEIGIALAISAGNDGNSFFISGSPGSADRAVTVGAIDDDGFTGTGFRVNSPPAIAGFYSNNIAVTFGGSPPTGGLTANVIQAIDTGLSTTDACEPLTNPAAVNGNIALMNADNCFFVEKVANAQNAGAVGAIVMLTGPGQPFDMAGDDELITIPAIMISFSDGSTIQANLPSVVNATLYPGDGQIASFSSRGPRGGDYARVKPDVSAPGSNITSAQSGVSLTGLIPDSQPLSLSGTSMAAPFISGVLALLRQLHPDWTVEELKAAVVNEADPVTEFPQDAGARQGASRTGGGKVNPLASAQLSNVAFNDEESGVVSVSYDEQVLDEFTRVRRIHVPNFLPSPVTHDLSIETVIDAPGMEFSLPGGNSITIPPGSRATIDVQFDADPSTMSRELEPLLPPLQGVDSFEPLAELSGDGLPRHWVGEESGYVTLTPSDGSAELRVPLHATGRPASSMTGSSPVNGPGPTGSGNISLTGTEVCTGVHVAGTCSGSFPLDEVSLVTALELQGISPNEGSSFGTSGSADLQYVGVGYDVADSMIRFGISTYGTWSSPNEVEFDVYIDSDGDTVDDHILFNTSLGAFNALVGGSTPPNDVYINAVLDLNTFDVVTGGPAFFTNGNPEVLDNALLRNNTVVLAATLQDLGIVSPQTSFRYRVVTCPGFASLCELQLGGWLDEAGPFSWDTANQGLNFGGSRLRQDLNGGTIPVTWNLPNILARGSHGALLLHHHNVAGSRAQVIPLLGAPSADLGVTAGVAPAGAATGENITLTVTATNHGASPITDGRVRIQQPLGTTYISDDGSYSPSTELWTFAPLLSGNSVVLHIVYRLDASEPVQLRAARAGGEPLDPQPANDVATIIYTPQQGADLALTASADPPTAAPGETVTFAFILTNNGPDPAYNVSMVNSFPGFPTLPYDEVTASHGVFDPITRTWRISGLGSGATASLLLDVFAPNTGGLLTSSGTVNSEIADDVLANNTAAASVQIELPGALLTGTMTRTGYTFTDSTVTYMAVVRNLSTQDQPDDPADDEFSLVLPASLTLVSVDATSGVATPSFGTNSMSWNGSVAGGGSVTITVTATIDPVPVGTAVEAQGQISFDSDGNGDNDSSAVTDDPTTLPPDDATVFVVTEKPAGFLGDSTVYLTYTALQQPCRVIDTRLGGGPLTSTPRNLRIAGNTGFGGQGGNPTGCGIPLEATAATINFVAVNPSGAGNLRGAAYPASIPATGSLLNYQLLIPPLNIANGIFFPICDRRENDCAVADITLQANGGSAQVVADVLGYFTPFPKGEARSFAVTHHTSTAASFLLPCSNMTSITVDAPVAGKVVVRANLMFTLNHSNGLASSVVASINTTSTGCQTESALGESGRALVVASEPSGTYHRIANVQRSFNVLPGVNTFYINAFISSGSEPQLHNAGIDAVFYPD